MKGLGLYILGRYLGELHLHVQEMMRSGLTCTVRSAKPSVVLASAVVHMHLLVVVVVLA